MHFHSFFETFVLFKFVVSCSYILFVPFEGSDNENSGIVYVWIGNKTAAEESKLIQEIAEDMFNNPWVSLQVSSEVHFHLICKFHQIQTDFPTDLKRRRRARKLFLGWTRWT